MDSSYVKYIGSIDDLFTNRMDWVKKKWRLWKEQLLN